MRGGVSENAKVREIARNTGDALGRAAGPVGKKAGKKKACGGSAATVKAVRVAEGPGAAVTESPADATSRDK